MCLSIAFVFKIFTVVVSHSSAYGWGDSSNERVLELLSYEQRRGEKSKGERDSIPNRWYNMTMTEFFCFELQLKITWGKKNWCHLKRKKTNNVHIHNLLKAAADKLTFSQSPLTPTLSGISSVSVNYSTVPVTLIHSWSTAKTQKLYLIFNSWRIFPVYQ